MSRKIMLCLTFDTDHMDEARMAEFLASVEVPGTATFFCTKQYICLKATEHEIAPHPTLDGEKDWQAELRRMREIFPEASGWRSHSCVFSHLLAEWLATHGYRYVSTNDQFGQKAIQPILHPWGIWHFPIFYMDNMDFSRRRYSDEGAEGPFAERFIETALKDDGIYVFDFHPIHLLLNTPSRDYYLTRRDRFKAGESLTALAYEGAGTKRFYERLCAAMLRKGLESVSLCQVLDSYREHRSAG